MTQHLSIALNAIQKQIQYHRDEIAVLEKVAAQLGGSGEKRRPGRPPTAAPLIKMKPTNRRTKKRPAWTPERRAKMMKIFAERRAKKSGK